MNELQMPNSSFLADMRNIILEARNNAVRSVEYTRMMMRMKVLKFQMKTVFEVIEKALEARFTLFNKCGQDVRAPRFTQCVTINAGTLWSYENERTEL